MTLNEMHEVMVIEQLGVAEAIGFMDDIPDDPKEAFKRGYALRDDVDWEFTKIGGVVLAVSALTMGIVRILKKTK